VHTLTTFDFLARLATGVACGALTGVERQWRARMAGLRTNALVATGATLFVLYSVAVGDAGSPTRVASYVVSGIGFLGGGVILRDGAGVRGLNTGASRARQTRAVPRSRRAAPNLPGSDGCTKTQP
jgi:putative Mg2+ transporter-C (MgtC) family protein